MSFKNRSLISIKDLTKEDILQILERAEALKNKPQPNLLTGKVLAACFFEPSTRTRLSFETAMQRLGGTVIGFADAGTSSAAKGESVYDAMKVVGRYADVIAIRHPLEGAARRAAEAAEKPVINGGDGRNQHPTQTLLDLLTIKECQQKLDQLHVTMVGDLKYGRTVHSLVEALVHFNPSFAFVAPPQLELPGYLLDFLAKKNIPYTLHQSLDSEVVKETDVIYMTRIQKERFPDLMEYEKVKDVYVLTAEQLKGAKKSMNVLHPLPRVNEIHTSVDSTAHAYYFEQAENGVYARQALLAMVLGK